MLCDDLEGMMGGWAAPEGGDICVHIADSLHCTAKTNTTIVKQPYHNKEKNGKIICNSEA